MLQPLEHLSKDFRCLVLCVLIIAVVAPLAAQPSRDVWSGAIDAYNSKVVVSGENGIVALYDAAQPQHPALLSTIQLAGAIHGVALAGDRILAAGDTGVYILRMATPQTMAIGNSVALPAAALAVAAAGNFGYAASGPALFLFDIPSGTILDRKEYTGETITHLSLAGDFIYLLAGRTLVKVGVTDHLPSPTASLQLSADVLELYADGQFVYTPQTIEDAGAALRVLSANEPRQDLNVRPLGNGQFVECAGSGACTLYGGHMYTAGGSIAVSTPVTPSGTKTAPFVQLGTNLGTGNAIENSLVRVTAQVSAADAIRTVDFYVNGVKAATDGNYPFEYRMVAPGAASEPSLTLSACATDLDGNTSCSAAQTLQVAKDKTPLHVLSVTPANGSHSAARSLQQIEARFSHPLDLSTASAGHVRLERIDPRSGAAIQSVNSAVTFEPAANRVLIVPAKPLPSGSYQANLSAAIASSTGARLGHDYTWKFDAGADDTWINPASGNWNVASNWSGGTVPQAGDNVTIAISGVTVTYNTGTLAIDNLTVGSGSTLSVAGGTLGVDGAGTIAGTLAFASGTFNGTGTTTVSGQFNWTGGTLDTALTIASTASALISPNNPNALPVLQNGVTLTNDGTVDHNAGAYPLYIGGTVNNASGATWNLQTDGAVDLQTGGLFNNAGTFNKTGGTSTTTWQVPITGSGPINIASGSLTLTGATTGTISGAINISSGAAVNYEQNGSTLAKGGVTGSGTFSFATGTANISVTVAGAYAFAGVTQILVNFNYGSSPSVSFTGHTTMANVNFSGGTASGGGALTITGQWSWTGGVMSAQVALSKTGSALISPANPNALPQLASGSTFSNDGTVDLDAGGYPFYIGGTVNNASGATWNLQTDGAVDLLTGGVFNNAGTFNKTGGTSTTTWQVPITGSGPINIASGTLTLTGATAGTISGAINISSGAAVNYEQNGSTLAKGGVTGSGTFSFATGTANISVTVAGAYTFAGVTQILVNLGYLSAPSVSFTGHTTMANLNFSGGTASGAGALTITGQWSWTGGVMSAPVALSKTGSALISPANPNALPQLASGATFTNAGTVDLDAGGYPFYIGGTVNNASGATWNLQTDGAVDLLAGGTFVNAGSFNKTGGTSTTTWQVPITGSGPINIASGTLTLTGATTGTISGAINISTGAAVNYEQSGSTLAKGGVTGSGTFSFATGTANISVTVAGAYAFAGVTQILVNLGYLSAPSVSFTGHTTMANVNFSGGTMSGAGALTITGQWSWTGGVMSAQVALSKTGSALISPANPNALPQLASSATFTNDGTVDLDAGGYPFSIGGTVDNNAIWNLQTDGAVNLIAGGTFNNSGSFKKTGGTSTTNWQVPITGSGSINISSGTLSLSGATAGSISGKINISSGAAMVYGQAGSTLSSPGGVTGKGTFTVTASATVAGGYDFSGQVQIEIPGTGTLSFLGSVDFDNLNFTSGQLLGVGGLTVSGDMDWSGGTVATTGTFTVNSLSLSSTGSVTIALGQSQISITDKITLAGNLSLSFGVGYDPPVGTVVPIFSFSAGFGGGFGSIFDLELGDGDPLSVDLSSSGLSVTVEAPPAQRLHQAQGGR